jgi:tRNA uridine 5-carboxymethylaminomethyl modification enzyme
LRTDNAAERLSPVAITSGLLSGEPAKAFLDSQTDLEAGRTLLKSLKASPHRLKTAGFEVRQDGVLRTAHEWLRFPMIGPKQALLLWPELHLLRHSLLERLAIDAAYETYLERQAEDLASFHRDEALSLPSSLDYSSIPALSHEMVERLTRARPETLGAAGRVPGITPAALIALLPYTKKRAA